MKMTITMTNTVIMDSLPVYPTFPYVRTCTCAYLAHKHATITAICLSWNVLHEHVCVYMCDGRDIRHINLYSCFSKDVITEDYVIRSIEVYS